MKLARVVLVVGFVLTIGLLLTATAHGVFQSYGVMVIETTTDHPVVVLSFDTEIGMRDSAVQVLDMLDRQDISATFFVTGDFIENYPNTTARLASSRHEFGSHSYRHPDMTNLTDAEQRFMITEQKAAAAKYGATPVGFLAPYRQWNGATEAILREEGFRYDATYYCFNNRELPTPQVTPHPTSCSRYHWDMPEKGETYLLEDDFLYGRKNMTSAQVLAVLKDGFDFHAPRGEVVIIAFHPTTRDDRISMLEEFVVYAKAQGAEFATHEQLEDMLESGQARLVDGF